MQLQQKIQIERAALQLMNGDVQGLSIVQNLFNVLPSRLALREFPSLKLQYFAHRG